MPRDFRKLQRVKVFEITLIMSESPAPPPDDFEQDPNYEPRNTNKRQPKRKPERSKFETPQKRAKTTATVNTSLKVKVDRISTFKERRCLVTCESFRTQLQYAHVLNRRKTPSTVVSDTIVKGTFDL
jgi:hypothetical protein